MKAKVISFFMALGLIALATGPLATAQIYDDQEIDNGITVGPEIALPVGDFNDVADPGLGVTVSLIYGWTPQVDFIGTIGYLMWGGKDNELNFSAIPVEFGAKYFFSTAPSRLYVGGLFGIHSFKTEVEFIDPVTGRMVTESDREAKFSLAPMIGYETPLGETFLLDASVRYQFVADNFSYIALRAAANFMF